MKKWIVAAVILVLVAGGAGVYVYRVFNPPESAIPPPANAALAVTETRAVDLAADYDDENYVYAERPDAIAAAEAQAVVIAEQISSYYTLAMLRPTRWGPTPSPSEAQPPAEELAGFFSEAARGSVTDNLDALAIGSVAGSLRHVAAIEQTITKLSIDVNEDLTTPYAIATVAFRGEGTPKLDKQRRRELRGSKEQETVKVQHSATFWLRNEGDAYRIFAYTAMLKADTEVAAAAWGAP